MPRPPIDPWPFDDPVNVACITTWRILREGMPILMVTHDEDDGSWQFLDGGSTTLADAAIVGLGEMVRKDLSLAELFDLPLGWKATRPHLGAPWHRSPHAPTPDDDDSDG